MLPEMPRGRPAESPQAGRGNLQTQSRMGQELQKTIKKAGYHTFLGFPGGSAVKQPALRETWPPSLDQEDPPEKERLPTLGFWPGGFAKAGQSDGFHQSRAHLGDFTFISYIPRKVLLWSRRKYK